MSKLVIIVVLISCLTNVLANIKNNGPGFWPIAPIALSTPEACKRSECASYDVVKTSKDFEIRSYKPSYWMATNPIRSTSFMDAVIKGFVIINAFREAGSLNMTIPVIMDVKFQERDNNKLGTFVVYFHLQSKFQLNPPLRSKDVNMVTYPKRRYAAVRRYTGSPNDTNIGSQAFALRKSIEVSGLRSSGESGYTVAIFDGPSVPINRVNEIMIWFDGIEK